MKTNAQMPFPASFNHRPPNMLASSSSKKRARPLGLWKASVGTPRYTARKFQERQSPPRSLSEPGSDDADNEEEEDDDADSIASSSSKKRRFEEKVYSSSDDEDIFYWDYSQECTPYPHRISSWAAHTKVMDTSTTAGPGVVTQLHVDSCTLEDWEDLKDLFARAAELYENEDPSEALPTLRGVIHECHRFLICYEDPSVVFRKPPPKRESSTDRETSQSREQSHEPSSEPTSQPMPTSKGKKCKCKELPTAFHAILGTSLFLFGNLISQDSSLALEGEPDNPIPYWLAALDVFETGENLPSRTNGTVCEQQPEDWRMAIIWGRTLLCIADEAVNRAREARQSQSAVVTASSSQILETETIPGLTPVLADFSADEPEWPPESPFAAIAARRPPVTRRMSLTSSTPNELLMLAMDQFSRGIFHMPHPRTPPTQPAMSMDSTGAGNASAGTSTEQASSQGAQETFSRAKELYTIASEVLLLAEKLDPAPERQRWASWADSVFNQMKMESDMDAWRGPITRARGKCWLIMGSAWADELEAALEEGDTAVLESEEAQEARDGLSKAISFFEYAKGSARAATPPDPEMRELQALLAEALLTLANLTVDETKREELYERAQIEGGITLDMDEDQEMEEV